MRISFTSSVLLSVVAILLASSLARAQTAATPATPTKPWDGLGPIPSDLGEPASTPNGTISLPPPEYEEHKLPTNEQAAMDAANEFYRDHKVKAPDGSDMDVTVSVWIQTGHLKFGEVPDNDNACYGQGEMTVNRNACNNIMRKTATKEDRDLHVVELSQTMYHEFQHAHQEKGDPKNPRKPWTVECETEAWTKTLSETERWVKEATPKSMTGATSKQLGELVTLTTAWSEYNNYYQNKIDQKIINDERSWKDASGKAISVQDRINQMADLRRQATAVRDSVTVLESMTGAQPGKETFDQLIDKIPDNVTTKAELEKYVKTLAENAVPRVAALSPWQTKRKQLIVDRLLKSYPRIETSWTKRRLPKVMRDKFAAVSAGFASLQLPLKYSPQPAVIDPSQGTTVKVAVTADSQSVDKALQELRFAIRSLKGNPTVSIQDDWTTLPEGAGGNYEFDEPQEVEVKLKRTIAVSSQGSSYDKLLNKSFTVEGATLVKVEKVEFPSDIGGNWNGTLVFTHIPGADEIRRKANNSGPFGEGCPLALLAVLNLQGKPMQLTTTIAPDNFSGGRLWIAVVPPGKSTADKRIMLTYRYANGSITATGSDGDSPLRFEARFEPLSAAGWSFKGEWTATIQPSEVLPQGGVIRGSWSGTNPKAK